MKTIGIVKAADVIHITVIIEYAPWRPMILLRGKNTTMKRSMAIVAKLWVDTSADSAIVTVFSLHKKCPNVPSISHLDAAIVTTASVALDTVIRISAAAVFTTKKLFGVFMWWL